MQNLCFGPLEQKKREKMGLSPVGSVFLQTAKKTPGLSPLDAAWAGDPNTGTLCLAAQSEIQISLPSGGSSLSPAANTYKSGVCPFCVPALSADNEVVSACAWLHISSSGSPQPISGRCSPLYFYFQLGSGRQCKITSPTSPPSCHFIYV